ncbi:hypothetical protein GCM10028773_27870 [Spirosoma koreense]
MLTGLLACSSLTFWSCSGNKKEASSETNMAASDSTAGSDSSVFGRQGDTTGSSMNAPQQAPPDSGDRGAVVPAEVKVVPKK